MGPKWTFATNSNFLFEKPSIQIFKLYDPFYGWGLTVSRLHSHYRETVYFLPLVPK